MQLSAAESAILTICQPYVAVIQTQPENERETSLEKKRIWQSSSAHAELLPRLRASIGFLTPISYTGRPRFKEHKKKQKTVSCVTLDPLFRVDYTISNLIAKQQRTASLQAPHNTSKLWRTRSDGTHLCREPNSRPGQQVGAILDKSYEQRPADVRPYGQEENRSPGRQASAALPARAWRRPAAPAEGTRSGAEPSEGSPAQRVTPPRGAHPRAVTPSPRTCKRGRADPRSPAPNPLRRWARPAPVPCAYRLQRRPLGSPQRSSARASRCLSGVGSSAHPCVAVE